MTRLRIIPPEQFSPDQQRVFDGITNGRRGSITDLTDSSGGLVGPFNAMLVSPQLGGHLVMLGETLRFDSSLDKRLVELATITVAAHWKSNFEWWIHSKLAESAGVPTDCIESIRIGNVPPLVKPHDIAVYRFTNEMLKRGHVDNETYGVALEAVGEVGLVELVALLGYYCIISFILNAFRVEIPSSTTPAWISTP